jgi:hypothetical protein
MKKRSAHLSNPSPALEWHVLYHAALFETDGSKLPQRIAEAEKAILARVKNCSSSTAITSKKIRSSTTLFMLYARCGTAYRAKSALPEGRLLLPV